MLKTPMYVGREGTDRFAVNNMLKDSERHFQYLRGTFVNGAAQGRPATLAHSLTLNN